MFEVKFTVLETEKEYLNFQYPCGRTGAKLEAAKTRVLLRNEYYSAGIARTHIIANCSSINPTISTWFLSPRRDL